MKLPTLISCVLLCLISYINANALELKAHAPKRYVVQQGDTLWKVAQKYLVKPWQWKQIWNKNPHIQNPNRLYAGDILVLRGQRGRYYLSTQTGGTVNLSPKTRREKIDNAIPTIPLSEIKPFLIGSEVYTSDRLEHAPYIVAFSGEHLMVGLGDKVFVKGLDGGKHNKFAIFRPSGMFIDPETKKILGYDAQRIGEAELIENGEPAIILINEITKGVKIGDRVLPDPHQPYDAYFLPQSPSETIHGTIVHLYGGLTQIGSNQVVVINRGHDHDLQPGDVLGIYQKPRVVRDPMNYKEKIPLPGERTGELMLFKIFDHVSFGLVVHATQAIRELDTVANP